jgi:FAD/FMN-containing dehydrogenase
MNVLATFNSQHETFNMKNTFTTLENFGHSMSAPSYLIKPKAADEIYEAFQLARKKGLTVTLRGAGRSYNDA